VAKLQYCSGEEIRPGDVVRYHGDPGKVEFVVNKLTGDPAMDWHLNTNGPGAMVSESEPKHFGRVYVVETQDDEDLEFVARGPTK
jgi:hypothetical protein